MKKKNLYLAGAAVLAYLLLLFLLQKSEAGVPDANINSFGDAFWYSLVTLTTVGYGDVFPISRTGRLIGFVFLLLSAGLLAALVSAMLSLLAGRLFPVLRLRLSGRKEIWLFSTWNSAAEALAADLSRNHPDSAFVICGEKEEEESRLRGPFVRIYSEVPVCLQALGDAHCVPKAVFLVEEDAWKNLQVAEEVEEAREKEPAWKDTEVFCMAPESTKLVHTRFFAAEESAARLYWQQNPLQADEHSVAIAGDGKLARAILDEAVTAGCRLPFAGTEYHLFGDWSGYTDLHPELEKVFGIGERKDGRDALLFHPEGWQAGHEALLQADRIIFAFDGHRENAEAAASLVRFYPVEKKLHAGCGALPAPGTAFGREEELFTEALVMKQGLDARAAALHGMYGKLTGTKQPGFEELSPFLRASNRAAADHLQTKLQILIPERPVTNCTREECRLAYERFAGMPDKEPFLRNEHERWMRFHCFYNWRYAKVRDNAKRLHPCLVPFEALSVEDREKDINAWEQIGLLAREDM